jgi:hypothetical protein
LVDNIDETGCCDRLFGQVVVTGYLYRFGAWLMHLLMVQVDDAWLMHGTCWHRLLVQVVWCRFIGTCCYKLLVQVDSGSG